MKSHIILSSPGHKGVIIPWKWKYFHIHNAYNHQTWWVGSLWKGVTNQKVMQLFDQVITCGYETNKKAIYLYFQEFYSHQTWQDDGLWQVAIKVIWSFDQMVITRSHDQWKVIDIHIRNAHCHQSWQDGSLYSSYMLNWRFIIHSESYDPLIKWSREDTWQTKNVISTFCRPMFTRLKRGWLVWSFGHVKSSTNSQRYIMLRSQSCVVTWLTKIMQFTKRPITIKHNITSS